MTEGRVLVLKLGGSLAECGRLADIADRVATATVPVVVVPGGGPFADAVRALQPRYAYSDVTAHQLALLAMHQMGLVVAAWSPRFQCAGTLEAIGRALDQRLVPVWLPYALQHNETSLPADWSVTSDSLAARLAERLGNATVALVKSCAVPPGATLDCLTRSGVVDPMFGAIVERAGLTWRVYGGDDCHELQNALHP